MERAEQQMWLGREEMTFTFHPGTHQGQYKEGGTVGSLTDTVLDRGTRAPRVGAGAKAVFFTGMALFSSPLHYAVAVQQQGG